MAVHDWSKVVAGNFHDFHQAWIAAIRFALNDGLLPNGFYAMAEQVAKGPIPDLLALQSRQEETIGEAWDFSKSSGVMTLADRQPKVRYVETADEDIYALRADHVTIRHKNGDRIVAYIEIVSSGNKNSEGSLDKLIEKLSEALDRRCHLMVIDLHHPQTHDPRGVHAAFWEFVQGTAHGVTEDQPLGVSSYRAGDVPVAYFEPVGIGQTLPDMPLFLTEQHYIELPLEQTYLTAWRGTGAPWRQFMEAPAK